MPEKILKVVLKNQSDVFSFYTCHCELVVLDEKKLRFQDPWIPHQQFHHGCKIDISRDIHVWEEKSKYFRGWFQMEAVELHYEWDCWRNFLWVVVWRELCVLGLVLKRRDKYVYWTVSFHSIHFELWVVAKHENDFWVKLN